MELEFLKEERFEDDLPAFSENWKACSFQDKRSELEKKLIQSTGYGLHQNVKAFRKLSFIIKKSVGLERVIELSIYLRKKFSLDCFQIGIDDIHHRAHMLFLWMNENGERLVLTAYDWTKLTVCVIRFLNFPRPELSKSLTRYFLQDAYEMNTETFRTQIDVLFHAKKIPGLNYTLIQDALIYAEYMCKGQCK